jgi:hypothetical protein
MLTMTTMELLKHCLVKGGSTTLKEVLNLVGPFTERLNIHKHIQETFPDVRVNIEPTEVTYEGVHLTTARELGLKASVLFICFTDLEYTYAVSQLPDYQQNIYTIHDRDVDEICVGVDTGSNICCVVVKATFKGSYVSYGAIKFLLENVCPRVQYVFKVGTAAGHFKIGTVVVLDKDREDIVLVDNMSHYSIMENRGLPSQRLVRFAWEEIENNLEPYNFPIKLSSATCGGYRVTDGDEIINMYEWELSGIINALNCIGYDGEIGMISVIIDNFDQ